MQLFCFMALRRARHKGGFCRGVWVFFMAVKLQCKICCMRGISWPSLVLSRVDGQLFVPVSSFHPGGFACAACTKPSRGTTGKDWPQHGGVGLGSDVPEFGSSAVNVCDRNCPLSCAGAATDPGPMGLQPRLPSHFMREKQSNNKRKFLTLFTGFSLHSLCLGLCWI